MTRLNIDIHAKLRQLSPEAIMPWLVGAMDAAVLDHLTIDLGGLSLVVRADIPASQPGVLYVVVIGGRQRKLPAEWVPWWVHGVGDFHNQADRLTPLDHLAPADTVQMQALQIGDKAGWFDYQWVEGDEA